MMSHSRPAQQSQFCATVTTVERIKIGQVVNQGRQADSVEEVSDEDNEIQNDEPSNTQDDS